MEKMADQHQQPRNTFSVNDRAVPWWIRFCRWLWKHPLPFLWFTLIINVAINIGSTLLITPANTNAISDTSMFGRITAWIDTHWLFSCLLLTISTTLLLVTWLGSRWPTSTFSPHSQKRERKLVLQRLRSHYELMLSDSLQGGVQMGLGLSRRPAAIHNAASLSLRLPEQPERTLPSDTSIVDVYKSAALLILGEPGAGKSTLLLELAHYLVEQAVSNGEQPLPILLSLSSWATHRHSLEGWLIEQSFQIYRIPQELSKQWIQADWVLPLLDGLDEMDISDRLACIRAINRYRRIHPGPLVVCSKTNEHEAASSLERLDLQNAVVVQPLSQEQVDAYLANQGEHLAALRRYLKENPILAELVTTPLLLQILIPTYHGTTPPTPVAVLKQVWTKYVQRVVKQKGNKAHYPLDCTVTWLGWLAQQMRDRNQKTFYPGKIPYWLTKSQRLWYRWSIGLLVGVVCAFLSGLIFGLFSGLVGGLSTMLFIGLSGVVGITTQEPERSVKVAPERRPSEQRARSAFEMYLEDVKGVQIESIEVQLEMPRSRRKTWKELSGMAALLIAFLALVGGVELFSWMYPEWMLPAEQFAEQVSQAASSLPAGLVSWMHSVLPIPSELLSCVCASLFSLIIVPFFGLQFESREDADLSIGHTLLHLLLGLQGLGLMVFLLWYWMAAPTIAVPNIFALILLSPLLTLWWFVPLLLFLLFLVRGPIPMLFHYTLRFWLWRSGFIPWNWKPISFLEHATACSLLRREGGGYSFIHPLLLEYFADLYAAIPSSPMGVHPVQQPLQP